MNALRRAVLLHVCLNGLQGSLQAQRPGVEEILRLRRRTVAALAGALLTWNPRAFHVQGGLTSAIFDETFGVLLYAAGRYNHLELEHGVFTARLEVDYKKVRPAAAATAAAAAAAHQCAVLLPVTCSLRQQPTCA
jgi:hypothetical protein